jgi:hypothetical protein
MTHEGEIEKQKKEQIRNSKLGDSSQKLQSDTDCQKKAPKQCPSGEKHMQTGQTKWYPRSRGEGCWVE